MMDKVTLIAPFPITVKSLLSSCAYCRLINHFSVSSSMGNSTTFLSFEVLASKRKLYLPNLSVP